MSHTMEQWEKVIGHRLRLETSISIRQFGFMPGRSKTKTIHLLRGVLEKYWSRKRDLHMIFINLVKAYDQVSKDVL